MFSNMILQHYTADSNYLLPNNALIKIVYVLQHDFTAL